MSILEGYWPWWCGAAALAAIAVGHRWVLGRTFGVSGALASVLDGGQRAAERNAAVLTDPKSLEDALLAATLAEFGDVAVLGGAEAAAEEERAAAAPVVVDPGLGWTARAVFLLGIAGGGLLAAAAGGTLGAADLGPVFASIVGEGAFAAVALVVGGALVGFGTQMAGGCTSGHGLNGCARAQPGSLVTTATFFGVAILVSLLFAEVAA